MKLTEPLVTEERRCTCGPTDYEGQPHEDTCPCRLVKTIHTAETLARALARQQRWLDRHAEASR